MVLPTGGTSMRVTAMIFLMFILSACAREDYWFQQGKTESEMQIARYECSVDLRDKYGWYGGDKNSPAYASELKACMTKKGYSIQQEPQK
jgi:hypothetical protein